MAISKVLKLDKSGGGVEIKPDSYIGLLVSVVHLGQQNTEYQGVKSIVDQLLLQFELQDVLTDKGLPVTVSKIMRNSMKPKASLVAFGKAIGANLDEGIDFEKLIGKPVIVEMGQNEAKTKVTMKGISALPSLLKKEVKPLAGTPKVLLDVEELTEGQISELPEWVRKIVKERVGSESTNSSGSDVEL